LLQELITNTVIKAIRSKTANFFIPGKIFNSLQKYTFHSKNNLHAKNIIGSINYNISNQAYITIFKTSEDTAVDFYTLQVLPLLNNFNPELLYNYLYIECYESKASINNINYIFWWYE